MVSLKAAATILFSAGAILLLWIYQRNKREYRRKERAMFFEERKKYSKEDYLLDLMKEGHEKAVGECLAKNIRKVMDDDDPDLPLYFPKLEDNLVEVWGIDEEKGDILDRMFAEFNIDKKVKWNSQDILFLKTTRDLLEYFRIYRNKN